MLIPKKIKVGLKWYDVEMLDTMPNKGKMGRVFFTSKLIQIGLHSNRTGRHPARTHGSPACDSQSMHSVCHTHFRHKCIYFLALLTLSPIVGHL